MGIWSYSEIQNKMPEGRDADFLYKQIGITAEDNLKLLNNVRENILILPLRLMSQSSSDSSLYEVGEQVFVSLFNDIVSLDDYFSKCNSIEDIIKFAREDIGKLVKFSKDDNVSFPLEKRFRTELAETQYMVDARKPDSYNFFVLVFGCIQQAVDIIASCIEYGCVPYIRYPVSLHYISLLSEYLLNVEHIKTLRFKMSVAFVVYNICDKNRLAAIGIDDFLKKNQE